MPERKFYLKLDILKNEIRIYNFIAIARHKPRKNVYRNSLNAESVTRECTMRASNNFQNILYSKLIFKNYY